MIVFLRGKRSRLYSSYAVLQHGLRHLPRPPAPAPPAANRAVAAAPEPVPAAEPPGSQPEGAW